MESGLYSCVIHDPPALALCKETGRYEKAKGIFESMPAWNVPQDSTAYTHTRATHQKRAE